MRYDIMSDAKVYFCVEKKEKKGQKSVDEQLKEKESLYFVLVLCTKKSVGDFF
jgi:hypothetical protein